MASSFEKHPVLTVSVFFLVLMILIGGMAEIALRFIIPYDIGYYTAVREPGKYEYPYGTITMNEDGYPDQPFDKTGTKKRIGYFGDSIIFGVGAGEGYRFSDLIEKEYPQEDHWTFSMIANGVQGDEVAQIAKEYGLNTVVYGFNLNDILPSVYTDVKPGEAPVAKPILFEIQRWIELNVDGHLRGHSYLYNGIRTLVKNALTRSGYSHTGFKAAELYPSDNKELIADVADRVNALAATLKKQGVDFCVVIFPYEMQISDDAAHAYHDLGIHWEDGFVDGSTQDILKKYLKVPHLYDGREAFTDVRDTAQVGDYFVYNKGDKIDFNHPNRAGHALIVKGLLKSHTCPAF
jgi:hypothetical protein